MFTGTFGGPDPVVDTLRYLLFPIQVCEDLDDIPCQAELLEGFDNHTLIQSGPTSSEEAGKLLDATALPLGSSGVVKVQITRSKVKDVADNIEEPSCLRLVLGANVPFCIFLDPQSIDFDQTWTLVRLISGMTA